MGHNTTTTTISMITTNMTWPSLRTTSPMQLYLTILLLAAAWLSSNLFTRLMKSSKMNSLNGPGNPSFLFGMYSRLNDSEDPGAIYEDWATEYGPAFKIPGGFGSSRIVICDPKANAHFYSRETFGYVQTSLSRIFIENLFGRGLLWAEGESHRRSILILDYPQHTTIFRDLFTRQRKYLLPAFGNAATRKLCPIFYDAAYKMKANWDMVLDVGSGEAVIDVQLWMNRIALDSIGIGGFGHDFHALDGGNNPVVEVFESFSSADGSYLSRFVFLMGPVFPILQKLPTSANMTVKRLKETMQYIARDLLERNSPEGIVKENITEEKSIMGQLVKASTASSSLAVSHEEILAQNVLLLAGYETTAMILTWALIELCRKSDKQQKLRDELSKIVGGDPTFEQLSNGFPYLDAIAQEVLRLHPPVQETTRVAAEDDIMPFSSPITTALGERISNLVIRKGTVVTSPVHYMNRAEEFWGADAREFVPERWLDGGDVSRAKAIQGHRHILTFSDGPRMCLGKSFALTEFKVVLAVLIRNYTFELPCGPGTLIEKHQSILPRPKVAGEAGPKVPLLIRRMN